MNSWMSRLLSAWAPPLPTFIIGTGETRRPRTAQVGVERKPEALRGRVSVRERDGEDGVRAETRLVCRPVKLDEKTVDEDLLGRVLADELGGDLIQDVRARAPDAFAPVPRGVGVAKLDRLVLPGRGSRRHRGATHGSVLESHLGLAGGGAARVQNLPRLDGRDRRHIGPFISALGPPPQRT